MQVRGEAITTAGWRSRTAKPVSTQGLSGSEWSSPSMNPLPIEALRARLRVVLPTPMGPLRKIACFGDAVMRINYRTTNVIVIVRDMIERDEWKTDHQNNRSRLVPRPVDAARLPGRRRRRPIRIGVDASVADDALW